MPLLSSLLTHSNCKILTTASPPIQTVEDLLASDTIQTANSLHISIQEVNKIKLEVVNKLLHVQANPTRPENNSSGDFTWKQLPSAIPDANLEPNSLRPTGIRALDGIFNGGFPSSTVVSVVGASASGKTYLSSSITSSCALLGMRVMLISSCNDLNVKVLQSNVDRMIRQQQNPSRPFTQTQLQDFLVFSLSNIRVQHCFDLWGLLNLLSRVSESSLEMTPELIVIDTLHHFISPLRATSTSSSTSSSNLYRSTSTVSSASGTTGSALGTSTAAAASELLSSLLCQLALQLKALTNRNCTVVFTNTPTSTSTSNSTSLRRYSSSSSAIVSGSGGSTGEILGVGLGGVLDFADIAIALERASSGNTAGATKLRAGK